MRAAFWIASRELRSLFLQPLAWVVLTVLVGFSSLSFWWILSYPSASALPAIEVQSFIFTGLLFWLPLLVFLPLIAMRLIAEERQTGTIETLLTAPVTETQMVIGKYAAAWSFYLVLISPFLLYLVLLARYGAVDWKAAASGFLGLALIGAFLLAAATTASALTRNQIVAAITGFIVVLLLYLAPALLQGQLPAGEAWLRLGNHLDLMSSMQDFSRGVISSARLAYPLTGIAFCLFVAARLVEASKENS